MNSPIEIEIEFENIRTFLDLSQFPFVGILLSQDRHFEKKCAPELASGCLSATTAVQPCMQPEDLSL